MRIIDWSSDVCSSDLRSCERYRVSGGSVAAQRGFLRIGRNAAHGNDLGNGAFERIGSSVIRIPDGPRLRRVIVVRSDRKSVGSGQSVSVRVDLGGRRIIKKTTTNYRVILADTN